MQYLTLKCTKYLSRYLTVNERRKKNIDKNTDTNVIVNFTTFNVENLKRKWCFNSIEDLFVDFYVKDGVDLPALDDCLFKNELVLTINGEKNYYNLNTFGDVIEFLQSIYWYKWNNQKQRDEFSKLEIKAPSF